MKFIGKKRLCFPPGDLFFFYSDGVTEGMNRRERTLWDTAPLRLHSKKS